MKPYLVLGLLVFAATHARAAKPSRQVLELCERQAGAAALLVADRVKGVESDMGVSPFEVAEVTLKSFNGGQNEIEDATLKYFVGLKSTDGYDCDFDVIMNGREESKQCFFQRLQFRMCAK